MILTAFAAGCFGLFEYPHRAFQPGETVLYLSQRYTQGRVVHHRAGFKLGEVTGIEGNGRIRVTPWDYPNRWYPGGVVDLDGKKTDGSEELPESGVFHETNCLRAASGAEYRPGESRRLRIARARFEERHALKIFENGYALFFRNQADEEAYDRTGNRIFQEKQTPTMIHPLLGEDEGQ
jgi:hypothetical protein